MVRLVVTRLLGLVPLMLLITTIVFFDGSGGMRPISFIMVAVSVAR